MKGRRNTDSTCQRCHKQRPVNVAGLCSYCWDYTRRITTYGVCSKCGREKANLVTSLCRGCYKAHRLSVSPPRLESSRVQGRLDAARFRERHPDRKKASDARTASKRFYDGNDLLALVRDDWRCVDCGAAHGDTRLRRLLVHHLDGRSRTSRHHPGPVNNELANLVTLCRGCHTKRHDPRGWKAQRESERQNPATAIR